MSENDRHSKSFSVFDLVSGCLLSAYAIWAVWSAFRHGVLAWGALGDYSLFVYVLVLGLLCSGFVFMQGRSESLKAAFLLLFLGYGMALTGAKPMGHLSIEMGWLFDFVACTTGFAIIAAGVVLEQRIRGRP